MGKNKDKKSKATDAAADLGFAKPSEASGGDIDDWKLTKPEHIGKLFLFTPLREEKVATKAYGEKPAIIADVVLINEKDPAESEAHNDIYIFSGYLRGSLKSFVGKRQVLGRLAQREDAKYKTPSWQLDDASQSDIDLAHAYKKSIDPFEQS
jgi:hypothetical protein